MSKKTRINRPTTATPRKLPERPLAFQSTHLHTIDRPDGTKQTIKAPGSTYRKGQN